MTHIYIVQVAKYINNSPQQTLPYPITQIIIFNDNINTHNTQTEVNLI